jgi:ribosomal protein L37AE/L43A
MKKQLCNRCHADFVEDERVVLGYLSCLPCGEKAAKQRKHTIVPMHKSNYMVITDRRDLMGINNKGGFYR